MFETLALGPEDGDMALATRLRKVFRSANVAPLLIAGDLSPRLDDAEAAFAWLTLLASSRRLIALQAEGLLGQRGIAALLASDIAFVGPDARLGAAWRETPGLAALAMRRGGSPLARSLLLGGIDTLDDMTKAGLILPLAAKDDIRNGLASAVLAKIGRRKRALRAAEALPFDEALTFELAFLDEKDAV